MTRNVAGETLLVPISGELADLEQIFVLNDVGSFLWQKLDGAQTLEDILNKLCEEYDVSPETAKTDLNELLLNLLGAGLVAKGD